MSIYKIAFHIYFSSSPILKLNLKALSDFWNEKLLVTDGSAKCDFLMNELEEAGVTTLIFAFLSSKLKMV